MVKIPVSIGELFDKITILEIKREVITDAESQVHILKEYNALVKIATKVNPKFRKDYHYKKLLVINSELWTIEDNKRSCERRSKFDAVFIQLARLVYLNNDKRAEYKKAINKKYKSGIIEVKSHVKH